MTSLIVSFMTEVGGSNADADVGRVELGDQPLIGEGVDAFGPPLPGSRQYPLS
jgi:hypothetical protein